MGVIGNNSLSVNINGGTRMFFKTDGNVGIGTTGPLQKLHVVGDARISGLSGVGTRNVYATVNGDLTTTGPTSGADGYWTRTGSVLSPTSADDIDMNSHEITGVDRIVTLAESDYDKIRVYSSNNYTIGMVSAQSLGYLNDWAMTFTMNNDTDRGFLWRDVSDAASDGAMSLTTDGRLYLKSTAHFNGFVGIGTNAPSRNLHIKRTGDAGIWLEADTDNTTETDNAYVKLTQDGLLVGSIIGHTPAANRDPENLVYNGVITNTLLIGTTTAAPLQFGTNDNVRMTIEPGGSVGVGLTNPSGAFEIEGDFFNQDLTGYNMYNSDQSVAYNASSATVDLGSTDYVRIAKADGAGANGSSILIIGSVSVSGNTITFADGVGGYQQVYALMNGMATFTVRLRRRINNGAWTTLLEQSAICGLAVGDWYSQYNSIANMQGKHGDEYRFPNSISVSYFDDPANGTIDYDLLFIPGGERKNGGNYLITDRNLTAVQIKR